MSYVEIMERVAQAFELVGAAVLVLGLAWACVSAVSAWRRTRQGRVAYQTLREAFGGALLLGIEVLVAADLIQTVAVDASLENVAILGLIVVAGSPEEFPAYLARENAKWGELIRARDIRIQ